MITSEKTATGCTVLFLFPFCAVGAFTGVKAIAEAAAGNWGEAGFLALFSVVFGGAGFGFLAAFFFARRRGAERNQARLEHPNEPWLWRPEWAGGRIEDSSGIRVIFAWAFALLWNLISLPIATMAIREEFLEGGNTVALFALAFPLVGIGLLTWAIRIAWRRRKYGVSVFRMAHVPGVIGRALRGVILTRARVRADEGFRVRLSCINRIRSGSGRNRSTREKVLWQEERTIRRTPTVPAGATAIPVAFRLPADVRETDDADSDDEILWRLEVEAEVPGIDYYARFQVPIFRTEESETPLTPEEAADLDPEEEEIESVSPESRIYVTSALTRIEIFFAAARNVGAALGLTAFVVVWTGFTVALPMLGAPIVFTILFGVFDLLMLWALLSMWLGTTRVVASTTGLEITNGLLGIGRTRRVAADAIQEIAPHIGIQVGNRPYYDIRVTTRNGKRFKAGSAIRDKREAEWLAERIQEAVAGT